MGDGGQPPVRCFGCIVVVVGWSTQLIKVAIDPSALDAGVQDPREDSAQLNC
jgi:hypothetical protein